MTYHVARNNQQLGQFSKEETITRYNSGAILPTDLVWAEGMASWQPASQVLGAPIAPSIGGVDASATPPPYSAPPPVTGVATPIYTGTPRTTVTPSEPCPPNNQTLSIVATIVSVLSCSLISLVLGIIAIVMSNQVGTKYNAGDVAGATSSAKTAKVLSWIAIGLVVIGVILLVLLGVIGALGGAHRNY